MRPLVKRHLHSSLSHVTLTCDNEGTSSSSSSSSSVGDVKSIATDEVVGEMAGAARAAGTTHDGLGQLRKQCVETILRSCRRFVVDLRRRRDGRVQHAVLNFLDVDAGATQ